MRMILAVIAFIALTLPVSAKCDPAYAPYYHRIETGPGAILADLFFLPFAVAIGTAGAPADVARPKRKTRGGAELSHHPLCMAGYLAGHAVANRPVRPEPRD